MESARFCPCILCAELRGLIVKLEPEGDVSICWYGDREQVALGIIPLEQLDW